MASKAEIVLKDGSKVTLKDGEELDFFNEYDEAKHSAQVSRSSNTQRRNKFLGAIQEVIAGHGFNKDGERYDIASISGWTDKGDYVVIAGSEIRSVTVSDTK